MPDQVIDRPGLAIISNSLAPYHVNMCRTLVAGIPERQLHVLVTHGAADFNWQIEATSEFPVTRFGNADEHPLDSPMRHPMWEWSKGGRLNRYIRDNRIDAVILYGYRFISFMRVMDHCHRAGIPFFVNTDSNIRNEPQLSPVARFGKSRIYDWWIKRASGVMSMGSLGDQFFLKYGADPARIYRVPGWPDLDGYSRVDEMRLDRFQQRFQLKQGRRYLVYSGRLVPHKRVDLLIDAFAAIAQQRPNWDLLIVGDGVLRDELQRRLPQALQSRVVWTGFLDGQDPVHAYHAADVLVLPSDHEPWALVVQEAMAAGLVVVSSDVSGAAYELVEDRCSGRIFSRGNLEQLKNALLDVTADLALDTYKRESCLAFKKWRMETDPVAETRRALRDAGVAGIHPIVPNESHAPAPAIGR